MKGAINRITRGIIAVCTFMKLHVRLTLHNDYVVW